MKLLFKTTLFLLGLKGLEKDQVCVMIHTGSRGLGHQVNPEGEGTQKRKRLALLYCYIMPARFKAGKE